MKHRRFALYAAAVVALAAISVVAALTRSEGVESGLYAPNFSVYDAAGTPVKLVDFRGEHLLVNFWGPWCAPCIREMESLYDLEQQLGGEVRFVYIGINTFYRDEKPLDPVEVASGLQTGLDAFHERLGRAMLVQGRPGKNDLVVHHLLEKSLFDYRGYWQRQFRARTNERYGIPATYLVDDLGRIRLIVHIPQDWRQHEGMLRDFVAGESLAPYDGEFEVPEELKPGFVDNSEDTEESRR